MWRRRRIKKKINTKTKKNPSRKKMSQGCTQPELPPEQVLESQSTGAAKLLDAMGARSCITGYAGGSAGIFPFIQGKFAAGTCSLKEKCKKFVLLTKLR